MMDPQKGKKILSNMSDVPNLPKFSPTCCLVLFSNEVEKSKNLSVFSPSATKSTNMRL